MKVRELIAFVNYPEFLDLPVVIYNTTSNILCDVKSLNKVFNERIEIYIEEDIKDEREEEG